MHHLSYRLNLGLHCCHIKLGLRTSSWRRDCIVAHLCEYKSTLKGQSRLEKNCSIILFFGTNPSGDDVKIMRSARNDRVCHDDVVSDGAAREDRAARLWWQHRRSCFSFLWRQGAWRGLGAHTTASCVATVGNLTS